MSANTSPLFMATPNVDHGSVTAANNVYDGTGTQVFCWTAGVNGGFIRRYSIRALGTNVATVLRVSGNNGSSNASAANNFLIDEIQLPTTTASATAALLDYGKPLNEPIQAGYRIMICLGTAVAAGWIVTVWGGNY